MAIAIDSIAMDMPEYCNMAIYPAQYGHLATYLTILQYGHINNYCRPPNKERERI